MVSSKVANRYASSLLDIALEKNILDTVYEDVKLIISAFDASGELQRTIISPVIKPELKISILDEVFSKKIDKETLGFVHFIIRKRREEVLYNVARRFIELRNEHLGIVELDINTAFTVGDKQGSALVEKFEGILKRKIIPNFKVDESLVGGFVAQVGDTVYNASMKHQLELLKKELVQGGLSLN
ncbi:MAG: ATP synthase F1 subunit delta [Ignavibacteria bacterium]|jgi:F-type H+-transporting ATPase subunit delta